MILLKKSEGVTCSFMGQNHFKIAEHLSGTKKFPGKNCRQIHGKSKASVRRNLSTVTAPKIC